VVIARPTYSNVLRLGGIPQAMAQAVDRVLELRGGIVIVDGDAIAVTTGSLDDAARVPPTMNFGACFSLKPIIAKMPPECEQNTTGALSGCGLLIKDGIGFRLGEIVALSASRRSGRALTTKSKQAL